MAHAGCVDLEAGQPAVIAMGVSGSGKSTVGLLLADRLGAVFVDADDLHTAEHVAKMATGSPLTDDDREPWLRRVAETVADAPGSIVVACSALRRAYRDLLRSQAGRPLAFVHLDAPREILAGRLEHRRGHFMPAALLDSQLETLEPLDDDEPGIVVDVTRDPAAIVDDVSAWLGRTAF